MRVQRGVPQMPEKRKTNSGQLGYNKLCVPTCNYFYLPNERWNCAPQSEQRIEQILINA